MRIIKQDEPLATLMRDYAVTITHKGVVYKDPRDVAQILYNKGVRLPKKAGA